jgi:RimJ/RimL family protein N-acetyltransferase
MEYVFVDLGKHRVYARVDPRNLASIALLERVGMRKQEPLRHGPTANGESADDVIYAILEQERTRAGGVARARPALEFS